MHKVTITTYNRVRIIVVFRDNTATIYRIHRIVNRPTDDDFNYWHHKGYMGCGRGTITVSMVDYGIYNFVTD